MPGRGFGDREVADRAGRVRAQRLAERGQPEGAGGDLREDAEAGQQPQHPVEGLRIRADGAGELVAGARAVAELVGDPELGDDADGLAGPVAGDQAHHRGGRGDVVFRFLRSCGTPVRFRLTVGWVPAVRYAPSAGWATAPWSRA